MGIQASVSQGYAPLPFNVGLQSGHMGLLNMAAYLPGFRSLQLGTPPLGTCLDKSQEDFWNTLQQGAVGASLPLFDLNMVPRMSQPLDPLGSSEYFDQWDPISNFLTSEDLELYSDESVSPRSSPPETRAGTPVAQFEVPGSDLLDSSDTASGSASPTVVPGTPLPSDSTLMSGIKRPLPDPKDFQRLEKRAKLAQVTEVQGSLNKSIDTEEQTSEPAARRKRKRTPESLERGRAESARARARRKVKLESLQQTVAERTQRAALLQYQLHALQLEAIQLRTMLFANFGISVFPGSAPVAVPTDASLHASSPGLRALAVRNEAVQDSQDSIVNAQTEA